MQKQHTVMNGTECQQSGVGETPTATPPLEWLEKEKNRPQAHRGGKNEAQTYLQRAQIVPKGWLILAKMGLDLKPG